jgi:hypothetical protein
MGVKRMKLKEVLQLYDSRTSYLEVHEVYMLKEKLEEHKLNKDRTLTIEKIYQDWSGLTIWMRDCYDKRFVLKREDFNKLIKLT